MKQTIDNQPPMPRHTRPASAAQPTPRSAAAGLAPLVAACLLAACSGGNELLQLGIPDGTPTYPGLPQEVYARVARGALGCWFGAGGTMKPTHIFHADVAPADKGGAGEIVLHERDATTGNPRGLKAMRITFSAHSETTTLMVVETLRLPAEQGARMHAAVRRWASSDPACDGADLTAGWQPVPEKKDAPAVQKTKAPAKKS